MLLRLAFALLACRLLLALALVPPWQYPDEPTHVARVLYVGFSDPAWETQVLQSMSRHEWWKHRLRGFREPVETPLTFAEAGPRVGGPVEIPGRYPAYIRLAGQFVRLLPRLSVDQELFVLRLWSAVFALLTLWIAWLAARECLGSLGAAGVTLLLALHPYFAIFSTGASPDPAVVFLGACMWWQATLAIMRPRRAPHLGGMWVAAIAAAATDRVGVPLVAAAFVISAALLARRFDRSGARMPAVVGAGGLVLGTALWAVYTFGETYSLSQLYRGGWAPVPGAMTWTDLVGFNRFLHQSWWYSIGWNRYAPPAWWLGVATGITAVSVVGLARLLTGHVVVANGARTLLTLAAVSVAIQLAAVHWIFFRLGIGAQGRYLFPMLVPSVMMVWAGIDACAPRLRRRHVTALLLLTVGILDAVAWMLVTLPAFYDSL